MTAYLIAAKATAQTIASDIGAVSNRELNGAIIDSFGLGAGAGSSTAWNESSLWSRIISRTRKTAR